MSNSKSTWALSPEGLSALAERNSQEFLAGMIPQGAGERTIAALLAAGLIGGPLAYAYQNKWDPKDVRKPHHLKVYIKKEKPGKEQVKSAELVAGEDSLPQPTPGLIAGSWLSPVDWGNAAKRFLMAAAAPAAGLGLMNVWSAMNEAREKEILRNKLLQLERGAVPKIHPDKEVQASAKDDFGYDDFAEGFLEKIAESELSWVPTAQDLGESAVNTVSSYVPGLLQKLWAPAAGLSLGLGGTLGYAFGRSQWKPNKPEVDEYHDPALDINYIDPRTGEVWGNDGPSVF